MDNGNNHGQETTPLIELGYNKKDMMVVMIVNGLMEDGKPFKSVAQLTRLQAWKLTEDLKLTINKMEGKPV